MTGPAQRQRIDRWLWHARIVRTRSDAAKLVEAGHVRVNGQRTVAASSAVRAGDILTVSLDRSVRLIRVMAFSESRGSAVAGRALYEPVAGENDG